MSDATPPMHPSDESWEIRADRPWRLFALGAVLVLAVDLLLGLVGTSGPDPSLALDSRDDVRLVLKRARDTGATLLIGDSVLAGDVLASHTEDWRTERVVDHMRREAGEGAVGFEQVALSGMLLGDILGVLYELDDVDPTGTVPVVIEVNPRFFSVHYGETRCAHPWLCDRVEAGDDGWLRGWYASGRVVRDGLDGLEPWLPILRHRRRLFPTVDPIGAVLSRDAGEGADAVEGRARLLEHYRDPSLADDDLPVRLLRRIDNRLEYRQRPGVFFGTPLNDAFLGEATSPDDLGHLSAVVAATTEGPPSRLVQLDHPLFRPEHFVDHCHLTVAGSRILALNLLHELGQPLRTVPLHSEMVHPLAPDQTLAASPLPGDAEGPSWVARFSNPDGVALGPQGQLVVADSGNHQLKRFEPPYQTARSWLGRPTADTNVDGPLADATASHPTQPAFLGSDLYFLSDRGRRLRQVRQGTVRTVLHQPKQPALVELVANGSRLLARDARHQVWSIDPATGKRTPVVRPTGGVRLTAMAAHRDRLFLADDRGRIFEHRLAGPARELVQGTLVFANTGEAQPAAKEDGVVQRFPRSFDQDRIGLVEGLDWIDRYGGLLVRYREPPDRGRNLKPSPGESHWRFFDLERKRITPWIRPRRYGSGHLMWQRPTASFVSPYHPGTVAIDQASASVFHLESDRTRLVRRPDGLLGMSRVSHPGTTSTILDLQEPFADRAARLTLQDHDPVSHLDATGHPHGIEQPYVVLLVGSSMLAMSDTVGMVPLGRALEEELNERLGYRDRQQALVFTRIQAAVEFPGAVVLAEQAAALTRPDVIVVDMWERLPSHGRYDAARYSAAIGQLVALRERTGAEIVVFDSTALDRMRATPVPLAREHDALRAAGFDVISDAGQYLHDNLAVAPWGSPPFFAQHASPWAIDAAADRLAARLYPSLRARTQAGPPRWTEGPLAAPADIRGTVAEVRPELERLAPTLPPVDASAALVALEDGTLDVLLDLRDRPETEEQHPALAVAALLAVIRDNRGTDVASDLRVRLVTFSSYDEYGLGAREAATTVHETRLTSTELLDAVRALP